MFDPEYAGQLERVPLGETPSAPWRSLGQRGHGLRELQVSVQSGEAVGKSVCAAGRVIPAWALQQLRQLSGEGVHEPGFKNGRPSPRDVTGSSYEMTVHGEGTAGQRCCPRPSGFYKEGLDHSTAGGCM